MYAPGFPTFIHLFLKKRRRPKTSNLFVVPTQIASWADQHQIWFHQNKMAMPASSCLDPGEEDPPTQQGEP